MPKSKSKNKKWTVIGFWHDNNQPFMSWVDAPTAQDAAYAVKEANGDDAKVVEVVSGIVAGHLNNDEIL